jgi:hypothetical protein
MHGTPMLDIEALRAACKEVAKSTLWQTPEPYDIRDVIDTDQIKGTVEGYLTEARQRAHDLEEEGHDPNIVTRAVVYLAHEHALPPMKDEVGWFRDALDVLLRLVNPLSPPSRAAALFMQDLDAAARRYRQEADEGSGSGGAVGVI